MKLHLKSSILTTLLSLSMCHVVFGQFYYDSIAVAVGDSLQTSFYENDLAYFDELFEDELFISYIKQDSVNELTASNLSPFNKYRI